MRTYKASELITKIQELITKHGDLEVLVDDPSFGWKLEIGLVFEPANMLLPPRFEIQTSYFGRPEGTVDSLSHEDWCIGGEKGPCNCKGKGRPPNLDKIVANLQHAKIKEELRQRSKRRESDGHKKDKR